MEKKPEYPFDEFVQHFEEVHALLEKARASGSQEDGRFGLEFSLGIVVDYMKDKYSDGRERQFKTQRFMLIMNYISGHIADFDQADFAVDGSKKVGALVSEHLLRAIHQILAGDLASLGHGPTPEEVMALAAKLRTSD